MWGERELLVVKLALEEWKHWLECAKEPFQGWTDHKNLEYLCTAKRLNPREARWALFFCWFNFVLSYRPWTKNTKPDALSRISEENGTPKNEVEFIFPDNVRLSMTQVESDLRQANQTQPPPANSPSNRIFVPSNKIKEVLELCHNSHLFCHPGIAKTLFVIKSQFWSETLTKNVKHFVNSCHSYNQTKSSHRPSAGLLRPLSGSFSSMVPYFNGFFLLAFQPRQVILLF